MFVKKLQFKNFKRFSDLTIDLSGLPKPPKLVLMIGSNGSGKSSLFDGFEISSSFLKRDSKDIIPNWKNYFQKTGTEGQDSPIDMVIVDNQGKELNIRDVIYTAPNEAIAPLHNAFYGRSSLRQTPRLTRTAFGQNKFDFERDSDRPRFYIDRDNRFENDIEHTVKVLLEDFFKRNASGSDEIIQNFIYSIDRAFKNIFQTGRPTSLQFHAFSPPIDGITAEILFKKGNSIIHYDLLSSGEKEVFNILINLLSRKGLYQDTIYFLDELDLHLNTSLQYNLLKEITENWIPDGCQLWTASHSLGFIDYANESELATIIDFDDLDYDSTQILYPQPKNELEVFEVAVPQETLLKVFKGQKIIYCENQNDEYYQLLGLNKKIFVGVRDAADVFLLSKNQKSFYGLRDRDYLTDLEIKKIRKEFSNLFILRYYCFENYIYHPDNISEISPKGFNYQEYLDDLIRQKNQKLTKIILRIRESRRNYRELGESGINWREEEDIIADKLSSDKLEDFYPYFDMKKHYVRQYIEKFNLSTEKLVKTQWFKNQIEKVLK
jgi:AAA domain, putative AbiEii toxin, Type IV TA system